MKNPNTKSRKYKAGLAVSGGSSHIQSEGGCEGCQPIRGREEVTWLVELTGELTNVGAAPASGHCQPGLASPLSSFHN